MSVIEKKKLLGEAISELVAAKAECTVEEAYKKYLYSAQQLIEKAKKI